MPVTFFNGAVDQADIVHKSGVESITGKKTFDAPLGSSNTVDVFAVTSGLTTYGRLAGLKISSGGYAEFRNWAGGRVLDIGYSINSRISVGDGIDFWMGTGSFVCGIIQGTLMRGKSWYESKITLDAPFLTYQAWTESGAPITAHKFTVLTPFVLAASMLASWANGAAALFGINLAGQPKWIAAANVSATVGAAGAAAAPPANPQEYVLIETPGGVRKVPAYLT